MLCNLLNNPLRNTHFLHTQRVWNHIGMITNTIDNGFCAELSQLITRKLFTFIATSNIMTYGTVKKAVVSTVFTAITNIVRKATVTNIGKGRTRPTKQTAYRCTFFVRYSVHK